MPGNNILQPITTDLLTLIRTGGIEGMPARIQELFSPENLENDTLDVQEFFPFAQPYRCIIKTGNLPQIIKEPGRALVRLEVLFGKAPGTIQGHINSLAQVFSEVSKRGIYDYRMLRLEDVKTILNNSRYSAGKCAKICIALKNLYSIAASIFGQALLQMDLKGLDDLRRRYSTLDKATANASKTPDIDTEYFERLENEIPMIIWDTTLNINYRMSAALLWLEMYVGLRPSELFTLKTSSHVVKKTIKNKPADYLYYGVPKLQEGGKIERYAECYMLPGAVTAFNTMLELRKEVPGHNNTDTLYILSGNGLINEHRFMYYIDRLFIEKLTDLSTDKWEEVNTRSIKNKKYHIPNLTQYRVHLCGYLYRQGIRLHIIELGMSHLTGSMLAYYVRVKDKTFTKPNQRVDNIIRTRINNDFDTIDHDEIGEALLGKLILSICQFRTYNKQLEKVKEKGYEYDVSRYTKLCRNLIFSEIRPALSYLERIINNEGIDSVLAIHPGLSRIIKQMETITTELNEWESQHKI